MHSKLTAAKEEFDSLLRALKQKEIEFSKYKDLPNSAKKDELKKANEAASTLHTTLTTISKAYFTNPTQNNYEEFKGISTTAINAAHDKLDKHRGLKQILGNLALAIAGLGVFYLVAASINLAVTKGKHFLFFKTKSEVLIDTIQEKVNNINVN